jgi:SnoaL-like protein
MDPRSGGAVNPTDVVRAFVTRINAHDNDGLRALMPPQHAFIDSLGNTFPYAKARDGWRQYFTMVPDYWIRVDQMVSQGEVVIVFGRAGGTFVPPGGEIRPQNRWETPAAWRAIVGDGKIIEWRVYCDNEPIREKMRAVGTPQ